MVVPLFLLTGSNHRMFPRRVPHGTPISCQIAGPSENLGPRVQKCSGMVSAGSYHTVLLRSDGTLWPLDWTVANNVTFRPWKTECRIPRLLQAGITRCFWGAMAVLLLVGKRKLDTATFRFWMKASHTPRSLQLSYIQCFSEVMAVQLLADRTIADNATFCPWTRAWRTRRFLPASFTQCFSAVMAVLWPMEIICTDNATFHSCTKEWSTARLMLAGFTQWHSAYPKWWLRCGFRNEYSHTMQHSTFGWGNVIHPGFCGLVPYSVSPKWCHCCDLWHEWGWTMQHSTLGCRSVLHSGFCRMETHGASPQWRHCSGLRACGCNLHEKCNLPALEPGVCYTRNQISHSGDLLLEVDLIGPKWCSLADFLRLGQEVLRFNACGSDLAWTTQLVARGLKVHLQNLRVILPDGHLLASLCRANPGITVVELSATGKRRRLT